jgi:hypothetical protein
VILPTTHTPLAIADVRLLDHSYIFLTRLVIPNAIIENRRLLHELYMEKRTLSPNVRFR